MSLSRLENFQNIPTGTILYVSPDSFDATDGVENRGTSPGRPFFSLQRALIEAALLSYVPGRNNDRNDRTTILVSPGTHYVDNRPGLSIQEVAGSAVFKKRTGKNTWTTVSLQPFGENTNFDIFDPNNDLYKYNSVNGGLVLPRGTSIVGQDLRKTKIRPLYVPDPIDPDVEISSIFNVTGSCYFSQFTFFDADITKFSYKNYTDSKHTPKYSHHKLTSFVYADGVNPVRLGTDQTALTDLEMYYYKITRAYDSLSGRGLEDFPGSLDFEPNANEFRIVGPLQENPLGISSIRAGNGDGTGDNTIITITTADLQSKAPIPHNFTVDTPVIIRGITESPTSYNGSFTVREVVGINTFTYVTTTLPSEPLPAASTFDIATVSVETDTVSSASPYIFNCSIRSVYGMNGMWADGARASGFKSMVVAQFTGVSLQKDNDAYIIYDNGVYYDNLTLPAASNLRPLYQNSRAIFKPEFESYHIRASNDAFIQAVSVFAIGYAKHFITESGADMSITNSNSNFGANALNSVGFRKISFDRDDTGYITHIIPPRELTSNESDVSWLPIDITKTTNVGISTNLYLFGFTDKDVKPLIQTDGYRVGARANDKIYLTLALDNQAQVTYSAPISMTTPDGTTGIIHKKEYQVSRAGNINSISSNVITLTANHKLFTGEKIRLFSDTGQAPEGLEIDKIYFVITSTVDGALATNQIKLSTTLNDALNNTFITGLGNNGGIIRVISSVTDKNAGEAGHPVQYDVSNNQWYVFTEPLNEIYNVITGPSAAFLGASTPSTYLRRRPENRSIEDRLYKFRYVIPKEFISAKPPQAGYILEESKNVAISTESVSEGTALVNSTQLRNDRVIVGASVGAVVNERQIVTILTEYPHQLLVGDTVKIQRITSTNNSSGVGIVSTYNGEYNVLTTPTSREFTYQLAGLQVNPGTFTNNINQRATRQQREVLSLVSRQSYKNNFVIYKIDTIREHRPGNSGQDGIYHLTVLSSSIGPRNNVGYGLSNKYFNQDIKNLYPQIDRDNTQSNPSPSVSYADLKVIGNVITDDKKKSLTFEVVNEYLKNTSVGFGITNLSISGIGSTTITLFTDVEHKLNSIRSVNVNSNGAGYPSSSTIFSANLLDNKFDEEDATCRFSTTAGGVLEPSSLRLNDVGSAHTVGETLEVQGGTVTNAVVQVTGINTNVGDGLELIGFNSTNLNGIYEIVAVPNKKSVVIYIPQGVSSYTANTNGSLPIGYIASKGVSIGSMILSNIVSGIATITTTYSHGLLEANKFRLTNANVSFYNHQDFIVNRVISPTSFEINVGIATTTTTPTVGKIFKYVNNSNAIAIGRGEEKLASRASYFYSGLSVLLTSALTTSSTTFTVDNANGINRGDYLMIDNEIVRVSTNPSGNTFNILRAQLGTIKVSAANGEVVKKIKVIPTEIRRPSFMRASGHTFEYLGYGPGNYSTALPQRQDRILTSVEVLTSQAKKEQGGNVVYTGMNDLGEFYTGSTKVSATTGEQTVVGAPILTFTGDDVNGENENQQSGLFDELLIRERITVEGGEDNNQSSQFYGPVNFERRVTNVSNEGIVLKNLFIRGTTSQDKLITVGISTPTSTTIALPKVGDISLISNPSNNYIGHVYKNDEWRQFGLISSEKDTLNFTIDRLGIGKTPSSSYLLDVAGTTQLQNLRVTGGVIFTQAFNLGDVKFENIDIFGTARFLGINLSGITTTYTQIHERGTSRLNDLEVVGVSSFTGISTFTSRVNIDNLEVRKNINVGIADSHTISTNNGNLRLFTPNGRVNVASDLSVTANELAITTSRSSGFATASIINSTLLKLGVGNTNQESHIDLNNDSRVFDYGLRIVRNSGIGSQSSSIIHRGTQSLFINANDNADLRLLTNNLERIRVGSSGTITSYQNNSETDTRGGHLRLTQAGTGDVVLSWDITNANANRRWYSGIDVSDGFSWKLANPSNVLAYGNENFDTDTKIKVDVSGNLTLNSSSGITTFSGSSIVSNVSGSFDLLNTNISSVNAFGRAETINLARNTTNSRVNINGTTQSTTTSNGALVVSGGVGIDKNLNVGGSLIVSGATTLSSTLGVTGATTLSSTLCVTGATTLSSTLGVTGATTITNTTASTSTTTGALRVTGGVGVGGRLNSGSSIDAAQNTFVRVGTAYLSSGTGSNHTHLANSEYFNGSVWVTDGTPGCLYQQAGQTHGWYTHNGAGSHITLMSLDPNATLSVSGDIIAFASDERLKENIEIIDNALEKVCSLRGFTYNFNDTAKELGFDINTKYVGVSAQEVQEVLSEAVKPAPVDNNYITVQYEKLVPLLIEAIKELKSEIEELKSK